MKNVPLGSKRLWLYYSRSYNYPNTLSWVTIYPLFCCLNSFPKEGNCQTPLCVTLSCPRKAPILRSILTVSCWGMCVPFTTHHWLHLHGLGRSSSLAKALHDPTTPFSEGLLLTPLCPEINILMQCYPLPGTLARTAKSGKNNLGPLGTDLRPLTCIYNPWSTFDELWA